MGSMGPLSQHTACFHRRFGCHSAAGHQPLLTRRAGCRESRHGSDAPGHGGQGAESRVVARPSAPLTGASSSAKSECSGPGHSPGSELAVGRVGVSGTPNGGGISGPPAGRGPASRYPRARSTPTKWRPTTQTGEPGCAVRTVVARMYAFSCSLCAQTTKLTKRGADLLSPPGSPERLRQCKRAMRTVCPVTPLAGRAATCKG